MIVPRYKRLEIEWKHFAVGDATCDRCNKTGDALHAVVEELRREFASCRCEDQPDRDLS